MYTVYAFNKEVKPSQIKIDILNAFDKIDNNEYIWVNTQNEVVDIINRMKSILNKVDKQAPITLYDKKDIAIFFLMLKEKHQ